MSDVGTTVGLIGAVAAGIAVVIKAIGSWRMDGATVTNLENRVKELEDQIGKASTKADEVERRHRDEMDEQDRRHRDEIAAVRREGDQKIELLQQEVRRLMSEPR